MFPVVNEIPKREKNFELFLENVCRRTISIEQGRSFHNFGPATKKYLSPADVTKIL